MVFDEVSELKRDVTRRSTGSLEIQEEHRVTGDFDHLVEMLYRDDDDGLLHITQTVATQRGFIVTWVARVSIDGKVGPSEERPVYVPEVARMVLEYQKKETPWILGAGEWHKITDY